MKKSLRGQGGSNYKGAGGSFGGDRYVACLDYSDSFMGVYICQFIQTCKNVWIHAI